ncbi:threonine/homoserine/homoserine lactone efflux protein [Pacificibacter maritimus]|uniref:Threonine/homoserine/homoserine lactone efflux protein n=1 Tax=Pacificibacter maritimus TaxID=762213 RepID=A0A3N4U2C8_9RHOB|nr:LysE family translocator [Pacificibacter maritimus]RPE64652.1 threonine/homoserine/homoserine lactone efflux protein [Pacificibacter maritimus]
MNITPFELMLYAGALFVLFLTPGPVWVAMLARTLSGGFSAAWPLALGVVIGDMLWPLLAVLGVTWIISEFSYFLVALKWVAVAMFLIMGALLIRNSDKAITTNSKLTAPGKWAGFIAGLVVIMGNPKAILFYMGLLPGFFDLSRLTLWDTTAICVISALVPLTGNFILAASVSKIRVLLSSPNALKRMNITAGLLLILVAFVIPFT